MVWDATFKNILKQLLSTTGISVITETDVPTSNQRIDFIILDNDKTINTPFNLAKEIIIGEFKSESDKLLDGDLLMLISKSFNYLAQSHGYGSKKSELPKVEMSNITCILFLGGSKKVSKLSKLKLDIRKLENGIYEVLGGLLQVLILEIDNIELSNEFEGLKLFAKEKIRQKTMSEAIKNDNNFIKSIAYFLYKEELIALAEAEGKTISPTSLSIRSAVESIGLKRVVEEIGLKRVVEEIGLKRVVEEIGLKQVVEVIGYERVIAEMDIEILFNSLSKNQLAKLIKLSEKNKS